MCAEKAEGYWLADHLHEDGEFHGRGRCWKDRVFYLRFAGQASGRGDSTPGCSGCVQDWRMRHRWIGYDYGSFSPDSYDSTRTTVHPLELPPLDRASVTHPEEIYVLLDRMVSVRTREIPGLPSPLVAVGRPGGTLPTSAFGLDFLDMGDPALCLLVPRLRHCLRVMDFASDIDPGRIFRRGRSVSPWVSHRVLSLWLVSRCLLRLVVLTSYVGECLGRTAGI